MKKIIWMVAGAVVLVAAAGGAYKLIRYSSLKAECIERLSAVSEARTVTIVLKNTSSAQALQAFTDRMRSLEGVKNVTYISSEQALENFKARHANDPAITGALQDLKINPLLPTISIEFTAVEQAAQSRDQLFYDSAAASGLAVERLTYAIATETQAEIQRINENQESSDFLSGCAASQK